MIANLGNSIDISKFLYHQTAKTDISSYYIRLFKKLFLYLRAHNAHSAQTEQTLKTKNMKIAKLFAIASAAAVLVAACNSSKVEGSKQVLDLLPTSGEVDTTSYLLGVNFGLMITQNNFGDLNRIDDQTACVLVEPVQGEAGVIPPEDGYLQALRQRCDETGTMLIFDEIQTGMGRTGTMFAMQKYGVTPDIVCLAKAFGGGMPLGAFISSKEIMDSLQSNPVLGHITTFGGHPVCCAAGLAALNYIIDNQLVKDVERKGKRYEDALRNAPNVLEIRRSGLLMAIELGTSEKLFKMMALFKENGIMSDWFLFCDTAFRISPPLTISDEEIDDSCQIILECLNKL